MSERKIELVMPQGHTVMVHAYGAGYPIVLLHGFPLDAAIWQPCCQALASAGYGSSHLTCVASANHRR